MAFAQILNVDNFSYCCRIAHVDGRKGQANIIVSQSEVSWVIGSAGRPGGTARPEKTDCAARCQPGLGTAKAVIAPRAVTVHASTLAAPSQESAARA